MIPPDPPNAGALSFAYDFETGVAFQPGLPPAGFVLGQRMARGLGGEQHIALIIDEVAEGLLGGANFYDHGPNQPGTVRTTGRKDVSTKDLPSRWAFTDEWYNLIPFPSFVNVLAEVDGKAQVIAPLGDGWVYEEKYDGYRMLAFKEGERVQLISRNRKDFTRKFPEIVQALAALKVKTVADKVVALGGEPAPMTPTLAIGLIGVPV